MNTGPGEALRLIDIQDVLKAVSEFCDLTEPFVGERFKKQLRNTIRAVPRAPLAAVGGDAEARAKDIVELVENLKLQHVKRKHHGPFESCTSYSICALANRISAAAASSSAPAEPLPSNEQLNDYVTLLERNNGRLRKVLKEALDQTGCDGDLCNYRWHEKARVLLGEDEQLAVPAAPLQPEGEQEPSLEDLAGEAAALLEQLNGINGDAVLLRANQVAFALRAGVKSSRQRHNLARADGYNDGFRQGKQSRATLPPETPSDAAMRAAEEVWEFLRPAVDHGLRFPASSISAIAAIITRNLAVTAEPKPDSSDASWRLWFDRMGDKASAEVVNWTANLVTNERLIALAEAGILPSPETPVGGEHVDFVFDNMPCCKVCGLVRPAEGWTRPCKGPSELSLRAGESQ